jgi:predicted NUDIX family phosphoesterase
MSEEQILVIRRSLLDELGAFQGICTDVKRYMDRFFEVGNNFFTARPPAEKDPSLKQLIPYVLLVHGETVFHYVRGKKSGEQRLVAKGSVGIGGHINPEDAGEAGFDAAAYRKAVERELDEEIHLESAFTEEVVGLINDDSSEVGQVHLGVVHLFRLDAPAVRQREAIITEAGFRQIAELNARADALETWSQLCVAALPQWLAVKT